MDDLRYELDALIRKAREQFDREDRALHSIAGALHQLAAARNVVISVGEFLEQLRQPVPLNVPPAPPPAPPPSVAAEAAVEQEWQRIRQQTFADSEPRQWPPQG